MVGYVIAMTVNLFDPKYATANPDLAKAGLTTDTQLYCHFQRYGINEGRNFSPFFNYKVYRASNSELAQAGLTTKKQLLEHAQNYGVKEERKLSAFFDLKYESSGLIANVLYKDLSSYSKITAPSGGAVGINASWDSHSSENWYIEEQRHGEDLVIGGLAKNNSQAISDGFKMFDWGFAHQADDGSFLGTGDPFHSTAFFVEAVAHTLLVLKQSKQATQYTDQIAHYEPLVHRAAQWMISPKVWERGINNDSPYTHRCYLNATALGLTGKLTGDRQLIDYAEQEITLGLSRQQKDGVNPEKGGYDSSYQMVGVSYAERFYTYFPQGSLALQVKQMINRALAWEQTRILPTGEINSEGNTRTAGQETGRSGKVKKIDTNAVIRGFDYWASVTGNQKWEAIDRQIAQYYYPNTAA